MLTSHQLDLFNPAPGVPRAVKTMQGIKQAERRGAVDSRSEENIRKHGVRPGWVQQLEPRTHCGPVPLNVPVPVDKALP